MNGEWTLNENIADIGGIKKAFMAYKKYVANNGEDLTLSGLEDFTNEQLFFIAYANVCIK